MLWQQLLAGVLVLVAAVYAARKLGPRTWRFKARGAATGAASAAGGTCGCGKGDKACH